MFKNAWVATYAMLAGVFNDILGYDPSSGMRGILNGVYMALFQVGSPAPSPSSTVSSQTEATYDGYARQAVTWFPTDISPLGPQEVVSANLQFRPTDSSVANTITQVGIVSALSAGTLLLLAQLATPVALNATTTMLTAAAVFQMSFGANYGGGLVWS